MRNPLSVSIGLLLAAMVTCLTPAAAQAPLFYADTPDATSYRFLFSKPDDPYLTTLRTTYHLDQVMSGKKGDLAKAQTASAWVHRQWSAGSERPLKSDPISILEEAAKGKQFRDVEYALVLRAVLACVGVITRPLNMHPENAATRETGGTHAAVEVWLREQRKWVLVDPQWDVIPALKNELLNASNLQKVLAYHANGVRVFSITDPSTKHSEKYIKWVRPYLYYFDTVLDTRISPPNRQPGGLMLLPLNAKELRIVQRTDTLKQMHYTTSLPTFYAQVD